MGHSSATTESRYGWVVSEDAAKKISRLQLILLVVIPTLQSSSVLRKDTGSVDHTLLKTIMFGYNPKPPQYNQQPTLFWKIL